MILASDGERVRSAVDISSVAFWSTSFDERDESFARLRATGTLTWHGPLEVPGYDTSTEPGFWAATSIKDISAVSKNHHAFRSGDHGVNLAPTPSEITEASAFFLAMDPPRHTTYRRIVAAAFTAKAIARLAEQIAARARTIVSGLVGAGEIDFVGRCSALLPMQTVCDIIGVPPSERENVRRAAEEFIGGFDPAVLPAGTSPMEFILGRAHYLHAIGAELAAHRRHHPADDLMTNLVQATVDGATLTDEEIGAFMVLMSIAGNDTTKQTTSWAMLALDRNRDQRAWLAEDVEGRIAGAVEEFVRYATPVSFFARTACEDVEYEGVSIAAGDKVGLFYCSGNRDESVFDDPHRFELRRQRAPHVGFGGGGIHYCLGAGIARMQLRSIFEEILSQLRVVEVGEPELLSSSFIRGIRRLPVHVG
jgi:cytochrome P450